MKKNKEGNEIWILLFAYIGAIAFILLCSKYMSL
jgi:hypothetical protein